MVGSFGMDFVEIILEEGKLLWFKGVLHSKLSLSHKTKSFIRIKSKDYKDIYQ